MGVLAKSARREHAGALALFVLLAIGVEARAHFLFARVGPMAESGRSVEVFFSEQAEAGDPQFIDKIAGTELYLQSSTRPGTFERLEVRKASDRLRANVPSSGSLAVVGVCEYGVLARPNQTPFLLRYYPKAVAGKSDELNTLLPVAGRPAPDARPIGFEIVARFDPRGIRLTALRDGKPIPRAKFTTVDSDLSNTEFEAGEDGVANWTPAKSGRYSIYVRATLKQAGEHGGKHYDEIREFSTLALTWPLSRRDADAEAVSLFERAVASRAAWNEFRGFRANVSGSVEGRPFTGKVVVAADGTVQTEVDDHAAREWVEDQVGSIVMHRMPEGGRDSSRERTRPVLRFADDDEENPLGRLLEFQGGRFASSYRVKDGQITVVNRNLGAQNMSITVLDNAVNAVGKSLPRSYLAHYWDAASGKLARVETIQERWQRIGKIDLPVAHQVTTASSSGLSVRSLEFSDHALGK